MNSIRFVPTMVHGVLDYVGGIGLMASPFIFGFVSLGGIAVALPIVLGVGLVTYSLLTDYELGVPSWRVVPVWLHLSMDFSAAGLLAVAPFVFGYADEGLKVWLPQVVSGLAVMVLALVTKTDSQSAVTVSPAKATG